MKPGSTNLNTMNNAFFVLVDVLETNLMNLEQALKKAGYKLRHEDKRNYNTAITALRKLRRTTNENTLQEQQDYGTDADMTNALLMTFIDRVGDDDAMAYKIYEYLKSYPSKLNLDTDFDWAFEHVFKKGGNI
jgi:Skp family chaperone for outer membrane proteins